MSVVAACIIAIGVTLIVTERPETVPTSSDTESAVSDITSKTSSDASSDISSDVSSDTVSDTESETASGASSVASATASKAPTTSKVVVDPPARTPIIEKSPLGGNYLNVGTDYVCEIVNYEDETFDWQGNNDYSKPTNNTLPIGTVDYCSSADVYNNDGKTYRVLRCGKRIYTVSLGKQRAVVKSAAQYGALPSTNNVTILSGGVSADGRYTELKLDVDWKAPFLLDVYPQEYASTADTSRNYTVSSVTYNYVDITFCYGVKNVTDDISRINFAGTPFSRAEWKKNTSDYTLRLFLRKTGGFYGWYADYDAAGNLVFHFLNPHKITVNADGSVNLNGAVVYLDVGHGGGDSGAGGRDTSGKYYNESDMNLKLALLVRKYLVEYGATVVMSRTDNGSTTESVDCQQKLKNAKPDYALCIHHDSSGASVRGMEVFHFNAISSQAAKHIRAATLNANVYTLVYGIRWHYYYCAKVPYCPVVLTENGFMSNPTEVSTIIANDSANAKRAKALADGIVNYFKEIQ